MQFLAKTLMGLELPLAEELKKLGAKEVKTSKRAVHFEGDWRVLYRVNLESRLALRVLLPIDSFKVKDEQDLYQGIGKIDWKEYLDPAGTLAVDAVVNSEIITHSKYAALKTKDAVVDQFRRHFGIRPSVDTEKPTLRIHIHIGADTCDVSLDSTGESLHRRGYRMSTHEAPINEVLAAGLIQLSGWDRSGVFIDPMCGSGTILLEATTYAWNIPPAFYRQSFAFMKWKNFDPKLWGDVRDRAEMGIKPHKFEILGYDKDFKAIKACQENIFAAHLEGKISVERKKFENLMPPAQKGIIITNPPYDERMREGDIQELYSMIGSRLKHHFQGFEAWLISSNKEAVNGLGLKAGKKLVLMNGELECRFIQYELYEGSKKQEDKLVES